jgi:uncharacterized protein
MNSLIRPCLVVFSHPLFPTYPISRHAAASYGQIQILQYLIEHGMSLVFIILHFNHEVFPRSGGSVNITDSDGDTPLYTVENIETAQFLVEHGATVDIRNNEDLSVRRILNI